MARVDNLSLTRWREMGAVDALRVQRFGVPPRSRTIFEEFSM
jgi:hypothetical protein